MPVTRRQFVQSTLFAGAGLILGPHKTYSNRTTTSLFGVHPFILQNSDAVFVMQTHVDLKSNSPAIKKAGLDFGRSVFGLTDNTEEGIPLTNKV
jgi:hypothetical protein